MAKRGKAKPKGQAMAKPMMKGGKPKPGGMPGGPMGPGMMARPMPMMLQHLSGRA